MFRFTGFGESHGVAIGGVIEGSLSGMTVNFDLIEESLRRRREGDLRPNMPDLSQWLTPRREADEIEWLSGMLEGRLLGSPLAFLVRNRNTRSAHYDALRHCFRPGHADYAYNQKYGFRDWRGGGRASARETVARVIAGSIALQMLQTRYPIHIRSSYHTPLDTLSPQELQDKFQAKETFGGNVTVTITGMPAGHGTPIEQKLNAQLAQAMMSIPSAIRFEMGIGLEAERMTGKEFADPWNHPFDKSHPTLTNHCGGIQGGISNGSDIVFTIGFHPVTTQLSGMDCLSEEGAIEHIVLEGRHDLCHIPRIPVIAESMAAIVLAQNIF